MPEEIKRLHYYDQQFLKEADFTDEQKYHLEKRRRHNRSLHTSGVVKGLLVSKESDQEIRISPGMAIDSSGREIVLPLAETKSIAVSGSASRYVTIKYYEEKTDPPEGNLTSEERTRWTEKWEIEILENPPADPGSQLILGVVQIAGGVIQEPVGEGEPPNHRRISGAAGSLAIGDPKFPEDEWVYLRLGENRLARLSGSLKVEDDLYIQGKVGIGTTDPQASLHVAGNLRLDIGEGLELLSDLTYFGGSSDARVFRMIDVNGTSGGVDGGIAIEGFTPTDGVRNPIMAIRGNGNVGIGTITTGNYRLAIKEAASGSGRGLRIENADGSKSAQFWVGSGGAVFDAEGTTNLHLRTSGTDRLFISNATGNVGIGTTSPDRKLHIAGNAGVLNLEGSDHVYMQWYPDGFAAGRKAWTGFGNAGDNNFSIVNQIPDAHIVLGTTGNGKVGIGTADPKGSLDIKGNLVISTSTQNANYMSFYRVSTKELCLNVGLSGMFRIGYPAPPPMGYVTEMKIAGGNTYIREKLGIGTDDPGNDALDVRGRSYSQGGWHTSNGDYAEYFESEDTSKIQAGVTVALTKGGKIRPAKKEDIPIGVVTKNSAIVGNSYKEWPKKYLRDEFGQVIMEEYKEEIMAPKKEKVAKKDEKGKKKVTEEIDVLDEQGTPVMAGTGKFEKKLRPKLNPEYDETQKYIPREERGEWNCVGLLGQLPLRKGQPVAPGWVKIKDISDKAELWLVK